MPDAIPEFRPISEDAYFLRREQELLQEARLQAAREAGIRALMGATGIADAPLVGELADAGFDPDTCRLLWFVPLLEVAWSDGSVLAPEREQIFAIAAQQGIRPGGLAYDRLTEWLDLRPSDAFFQLCLRAVQAMLRDRPQAEAQALRRDLVAYGVRVAEASGGFLGFGSKISSAEEQMLLRLSAAV
jgi:hypothetical protein